MNRALDAVAARGAHDHARADHVGRVDLLRRVQGQRGRCVHDKVMPLHRLVDDRRVTDIPAHLADARPLGVVEVQEVERRDFITALEQVPYQIDPEEARAARDQDLLLAHRLTTSLLGQE